jgi:hypothetical protein
MSPPTMARVPAHNVDPKLNHLNRTNNRYRGERTVGQTLEDQGFSSSSLKPCFVTPCSELRPLWFSHANELETFGKLRQSNVIRRKSKMRRAKSPLAIFDSFPSLFDRSEIPSRAFWTDNPETPLRFIERQPPPDWKALDYFIRPEIGVTEKTSRIHESTAAISRDAFCWRSV